jgi:hypothetical protein
MLPERPGGHIGRITGRAIQRLDLDHADAGAGQLGQHALQERRAQPVTAPGRIDRHPEEFRPARWPAGGHREAGHLARVHQHPAVMSQGIPLYPAGDIAGEVVRQAADDARDRGEVCGR